MMSEPSSDSGHLPKYSSQPCESGAIDTALAAAGGDMLETTMKNNISVNGLQENRGMKESQRALELRKFFAPQNSSNTSVETDFNNTLNNDGALDAYAETLVWRLGGVHAMVSLLDRGTQYFLAGATRASPARDESDVDVTTTGDWFGCSSVSTTGGLCENTLALDYDLDEEDKCFVVNDLSKDDRFATLPVVDGTIVAYRFYVGTPITTSHGINIGSIFLFDDKPRRGVTLKERKFLRQQARNVMTHLETKREATERRRVALMSRGIAKFLERTSEYNSNGVSIENDDHAPREDSNSISSNENHQNGPASTGSGPHDKETVLDKIRWALDQAADILRESLELSIGGVVFLDTAIGFSETGNTEAYLDSTTDIGYHVEEAKNEERRRTSSAANKTRPNLTASQNSNYRQVSQESTRSTGDEHKAAKVLAMSAAKVATWDSEADILDATTLQALINTYPKGNVWYTDEEGYFSSLEQLNQAADMLGRRRSVSSVDTAHEKAEATMLSRIFRSTRQIIFLPLWDAGAERWFAGTFVWSQSAVPVFTVDSEVAYLSAFTNSVMVEISRLDAITSNNMKSNFISSISHEFRSPLHGILASAELLRESELDVSQMEFIGTIQNCSGTLLDTINHVLDYSKINSFEKGGRQTGTISNELIQPTDLALLCEDVINGMLAASEFHGGTDDPRSAISKEFQSVVIPDKHQSVLNIVLDIQKRDWFYNIQAGAVRRVVMNIFGNAQKYTDAGYVMVQLRIKEGVRLRHDGPSSDVLCLNIMDSGRGMSSEYMERKLYHPFAQEDSFTAGVGLGLSIVRSIVNQLGGKISIRSQVGKGTEVEVSIPVEKVEPPTLHFSEPTPKNMLLDAQDCIHRLRGKAEGVPIYISRNRLDSTRAEDATWACIERYCCQWFGFTVSKSPTQLVITDHIEDPGYTAAGQRILVVHNDMTCPEKHTVKSSEYAVGHICPPAGPFRLARALSALLDEDISTAKTTANVHPKLASRFTQTPLGSPEERTIMNGIILTDYGFTPQANLADTVMPPPPREAEALKPTPDTIADSKQKYHVQLAEKTRALTLQPSSTTANKTSTAAFGTLKLPNPKTPTENNTSTTSLHILAVDDNALNLQLLNRYLLKRKSDTIVTARDGLEAVSAVKDAGTNTFDIIFMDISMPNMNGFEATRAIRAYERKRSSRRSVMFEKLDQENMEMEVVDEKDGRVRELGEAGRAMVVALTGLASRRDRDEAEESGFDDFLTKPISFVKIGEMLKKLSAEKSAR